MKDICNKSYDIEIKEMIGSNAKLFFNHHGFYCERLNGKEKFLIVRKKNVTENDMKYLNKIIEEEIGLKWGILHAFGKFLTWLTAIPYFTRYLKYYDREVSMGRAYKWMYLTFEEIFGYKTYQENTTQTVVTYILNHPEKYEVIYKKEVNL